MTASAGEHAGAGVPRQPLIHDAIVVLRAPTQLWSRADGSVGPGAIDGIYHGDTRFVRAVRLEIEGTELEPIASAARGASAYAHVALARGLDDPTADPRVRVERERRVAAGAIDETITVRSAIDEPIRTRVRIELAPEFATMHAVKSGEPVSGEWRIEADDRVVSGERSMGVRASTPLRREADRLVLEWDVELAPHGSAAVDWGLDLVDGGLVVAPAPGGAPWRDLLVKCDDPRLARWLETALDDLDALRLVLASQGDEFLAAGAPWFLTLFGRDAIWTARLLIPLDWRPAASTLRALAGLQGSRADPDTAEEPGKILHELRSIPVSLPAERIALPPVYYGTVDATPLWVCLLADARDAGMPDDEVAALLPALRRALDWLTEHADNDGDGFLDYLDRSGRGLSNQGWKDSGDSIRWRDGTIAEGPIALCEVQGYAFEAAMRGAELLEAFAGGADASQADADRDRAASLRAWAADLRERFTAAYWVTTPEGRYPAIALDAHKRPVDSLTSNIGHLIGTGILSPDEERDVARLLLDPTLSSGFGIRTMSSESAAYWPLSYHGGSVWTHDTAIAVEGLVRAGLIAEASAISEQLLAVAEAFDYRVPELHAGDVTGDPPTPIPYPAACRPQAWSAAASVAVLGAALCSGRARIGGARSGT